MGCLSSIECLLPVPIKCLFVNFRIKPEVTEDIYVEAMFCRSGHFPDKHTSYNDHVRQRFEFHIDIVSFLFEIQMKYFMADVLSVIQIRTHLVYIFKPT